MGLPRFRHVTPAFRTFCGADALASLPKELDRCGVTRVVVICGASMRRAVGVLERIEARVGGRLVGVFDQAREHSPIPQVRAARQTLRNSGADGVIALGGGSAIVTARAATILHAEQADIHDLCTRRDADGSLTSPRLNGDKLPQWIIPSTPTTAYAKAGAAVRDPATGERLALFDPKARPRGVFLDPRVALTAPVTLVQASALNAFAIAVEALQSNGDDPLAEAQLSQAVRMVMTWLPRLHATPDDAEPRLRLMLAALLSGQGTDHLSGGLVQSLAHATGPRSSAANGVVAAMLLPHTMRFNAPVTATGLARVADAIGCFPSVGDSPLDAATAGVERFLADAALPNRLSDVHVAWDGLPEIVEHTSADWSLAGASRPVRPEELMRILREAW